MPVSLPDYLRHRKGAVSFVNDCMTGKPFNDENSIFRCLQLHRKASKFDPDLSYTQRSTLLKEAAKHVGMAACVLLESWLAREIVEEENFRGIPLADIPPLEEHFKLNIFVHRFIPPRQPKKPYEILQGKTNVRVTNTDERVTVNEERRREKHAYCILEYKPSVRVRRLREFGGMNDTMLVNVFTSEDGQTHFSYIYDLKRFCAVYDCKKCLAVFSSKAHLNRHQQRLDCDKALHRFPGNGAVLSPTLFESLEEAGIVVEEERRYFPFFVVYDWESCQDSLRRLHAFERISATRTVIFPEEDPVIIPSDVTPFERVHWSKLRTRADFNYRHCVVRGVKVANVRAIARWLAEKQSDAFDLTVTTLSRSKSGGNRLVEQTLVYYTSIASEADFEDCAARYLTPENLKEDYSHLVCALRIECASVSETSRCVVQRPVSVAIATNMFGFRPQFLCRTADSEPESEIVQSFVDRLHEIQEKSSELMRIRFARETKTIEKRLADLAKQQAEILSKAIGVAYQISLSLEKAAWNAHFEYLMAALRNDHDPSLPALLQKSTKLSSEADSAKCNREIISSVRYNKGDFESFRLRKQERAAMNFESVADFDICNRELRNLLRLRTELERYCDVLPVLGFNSGRFDMTLIRPWLIPYLQEQQPNYQNCDSASFASGILLSSRQFDQSKKAVRTTVRLRFLDVSNYLAPFTSYEGWVSAYTNGRHAKGIFCYEYLTRPSQLLERQLPPREAFDSSLKGTRCSEEQYAEVQRVWKKHRMQTLGDYLRYYNLLDVVPFVKALENMRAFWREQGHDMFHKVCTLPGLADRFVRKNFLPKHTNLVLPQKTQFKDGVVSIDNSDLYYLLKRSIIGGPSGPYHRLHIAGETKIRGGPETCEAIVGIDCTAMYLGASAKPMPTQIPVRYAKAKPSDAYFTRTPLYRNAQSQLEWLEWIMHAYGITIRHQFNSAKAPFIAGQRPDGYHAPSKTVFYFDGCRYHGHGGCCANKQNRFPDDVDPKRKRQRDWAIRRKLADRGYNVISIRECEWQQQKRDNQRASELNDNFTPPLRADGSAYDPRLREFLAEHLTLPKHGRMTETDLIHEVERGRFFGVLVCDVDVPDELRGHFADFEPIFKHAEVSRADLSDHMRAFVESVGELKKPRKTLVNSFFARDFVLTTPLALWYIKHGLRIRNVTLAFEWKPKAMYARFAETVAEERRKADANFAHAIKGNLFKLAGSSIYGKTVTNVDAHMSVEVCDAETARMEMNSVLFHRMDPVDENGEWFEVHTKKPTIDHNLDTAFGAFVYQYAKLRLLEAYYDYLDFYWHRRDYQLMYVDTDSLYFAISTHDLRSFNEKVREDRRHLFDANYPEQFLAREDPLKYSAAEIAFDRRKAGLFHVETIAKRMCALNSKTYICTGVTKTEKDAIVKLSAKGVTRAINQLEWDAYYNVIITMQDFHGVSRTLRRPHGKQEICRIDGFKRALTYGFYKRRLAEDGITTFPLGL